MQTVRFGNTNLEASRIAFGAMGIGSSAWRPWVLDKDAAGPLLERALEIGISMFDTCNYYSAGESERVLGGHLNRLVSREDVVIATKLGNRVSPGPNGIGYSRKHILKAVDDSLRRLQTEYIDLLQTHIWREPVHVEEVIEVFHDLIAAGKVHYVGVADMPTWRVAEFVYKARALGLRGIASVQYHYNLVWRGTEQELIPFCEHESLGMLAYSPLARGFLADLAGHGRNTERARSDEFARAWYGRDADQAVAIATQRVAAERGISPASVALAWMLTRNAHVIPLLGATRVEQLDAIGAALECQLTPDDITQLEEPYQPRMHYGH